VEKEQPGSQKEAFTDESAFLRGFGSNDRRRDGIDRERDSIDDSIRVGHASPHGIAEGVHEAM
jgi:hypothetical protein